MSSLLRKLDNKAAHPERREYYESGPGYAPHSDPAAHRTTAPVAHGAAGTHAVGSEYANTGYSRAQDPIGTGHGKHNYMEYGRSPASGPAPTTAGPHRHDFMNKLDPRVDSTADHQPVVANLNAHHSKIANVLDPRVDSSVANNPNPGVAGSTHPRTGTHGVGMAPGAGAGYGHHDQNFGRHDAVGTHAEPGMHPGTAGARAGNHQVIDPATGPAPTTAGPHRHDFMNKLDPAVDSRTGATAGAPGTGRYAAETRGTYPTGPGRY